MKIAVALVACLAAVAVQSAYVKPDVKLFTADKTFLMQQKFFLEMLHSIHEPLVMEEYMKLGDKLVMDKSMYLEYNDYMMEFFEMYKFKSFLPRGKLFTIFNKMHLREARGLFMIFYYSKDWETFKQNVCWARMYMNEGVFVYALNMVVMHKKEFSHIMLPSLVEIFPEFFFNGKFHMGTMDFDYDMWKMEKMEMKDNYELMDWKMLSDKKMLREKLNDWKEDPKWMEMMKDMDMFYMYANYTKDFYIMNEESKLTYLTEDIDWNMFWYYFNMKFPFWMDGKMMGEWNTYRGESWLFIIQQILARYNMERLSHGMSKMDEFSWYRPIKMGYNPQLMMHNGLGFSARKNYYEMYSTEKFSYMNLLEDFERRISDVVDFGMYTMADGTKFDLRKSDMTNYIGNMLQGNADSIDRKFFGYWMIMSQMLLGGGDFDTLKYKTEFLMPNVMLKFETMMRDPLFYMLYQRVIDMFYKYKYQMGPYKYDELMFNGVKIDEVMVDKLVTFFDFVDTDVTTLMEKPFLFKDGKLSYDKMLMARQMRLNHKMFNMDFTITSDKSQKVIVRTFLGPKYDEFGREMSMNVNRKNFIEIDEFMWELSAGKNVIKRNSNDFFWTHKDRTTYTELYMRTMMALDDKWEWKMDMPICGFPDRLLLPRGWVDGMPMKMFFMVSPYEAFDKEYTFDEMKMSCGPFKYDKLPFGFPLDREIIESKFFVPNMYMKDVEIYHMKDSMMMY